MKNARYTLAPLVAAVLLSACALDPGGRDSVADAPGGVSNHEQQRAEISRVSSIETISMESRTSVAGAIIGGVPGVVVGGVVAGNSIEKVRRPGLARSGAHELWRVRVFYFHPIDDLRTGNRVKVEGGQLYRR